MKQLRNRYFLISDVLLLALAAYLSFVLRLEKLELTAHRPGFFLFTGVVLVVAPLVFHRAGVYSRYWRYASVEEMLLLVGAVTAAVVLAGAVSLIAVQFLPGHPPLPRSIPLIFLLLALAATAGPRFLVRILARSSARKAANGRYNDHLPQPVLIMGAGDAGAMIVRELQNNLHLGLEPVGFLDDNLGKHDVRIHGVLVLGDRHAIPEMVKKYKVGQVIIAMPTVPGVEIRDIVRICDEAGVRTRIIPGMYELLGGTVSVSQLRDVRIEDLLRREPVKIDTEQVAALLHGKRVLVTGAGGSIGSELCRQIMRCEPAELVLVGHGENSIFEISNELGSGVRGQESGDRGQGNPKSEIRNPKSQIVPVIADIRRPDCLRAIFAAHRPEIVFHAAAHKHVPLMEENPGEAITNNVFGTRNLLDAAVASGVERFVMVSTDKAVNPTNVMGATKRVAERLVCQAAQSSGKPYVTVRFGNVLGSRGSVVLTFKKQIAAGGPVTVTHPEVKRYFMTIPEAVQLVLQAAVLGQGGEVFVLDMGEPVKIADLARDLIELSGLKVGRDIDVAYTGLRPGEKLFEELFIPGEVYGRTRHHKIFRTANGAAGPVHNEDLDEAIDHLVAIAEQGDRAAIVRALQRVVPEYRPAANDQQTAVIGAVGGTATMPELKPLKPLKPLEPLEPQQLPAATQGSTLAPAAGSS